MTRREYMAGTITQQDYYCAIADALGRRAVEAIVCSVAPVATLRERLAADPHLNNIPLPLWDARHAWVLDLVQQHGRAVMAISWTGPVPVGKVYWSLSDTVCTLKAAARRLVEAPCPAQR